MQCSRLFVLVFTLMLILITILPSTTAKSQIGSGYSNISAKEAKELIEQNPNALILDVRSWEEYTKGYIPNAVNIPFNQIFEREDELSVDFNHLIIVYCNSGSRSSVAAATLVDLHYTNVKNIEMGLIDWTAEGYPLEIYVGPNQQPNLIVIAILVIAGLVGVALGFILQRGKICFNSALKKAVLDRDFTLLKLFTLTAAILSVVYFLGFNQTGIACSGAVLPLSFSFLTILAGVIFGGGMILAEGCLSGICYKAGSGYGGAIIALIGAFGITLLLIQPLSIDFLRQIVSTTSFISGTLDIRLIEVLSWEQGVIALLLLPLIILFLLFALNWEGLPKKEDLGSILRGKWFWWFSAIALTSIALVRLMVTLPIGSPSSLGVSGGIISLAQLVTQQSNFLLENLVVFGGVLLGAFLSAKIYGEFQIYIPPHREKIKFFLGGIFLAVGATLAAGCNLAHLSAGLPQFALSSITFLSTIIITNATGQYLLDRSLDKEQIPEKAPWESKDWEPRDTVIWTLTQLKEATTTEIIEKAGQISHECKDRVSGNLAILLKEGIVQRTISKEKKAFVWSLVSPEEISFSSRRGSPVTEE
ncbi:MAG: YeeE/YedE thiosulfate transporter family protein [Candidatus Hodarchaeota archaeon]